MPLPDFDDDERYVIDYLKSSIVSSGTSAFTYGYILAGCAIAGFALYYDLIYMMLFAFLLVCGNRIYEERYEAKWTWVWRSVIEKYEAAALGGPDTRDGETRGAQ